MRPESLTNSVYYSHSISMYDTIEEQKERAFIRSKFGGYFCPNMYFKVKGEFSDTLKDAIYLVCSSNKIHDRNSGQISQGVYYELKDMLNKGRKCFYIGSLPNGKMTLIEIIGVQHYVSHVKDGGFAFVVTNGLLEKLPRKVQGQI